MKHTIGKNHYLIIVIIIVLVILIWCSGGVARWQNRNSEVISVEQEEVVQYLHEALNRKYNSYIENDTSGFSSIYSDIPYYDGMLYDLTGQSQLEFEIQLFQDKINSLSKIDGKITDFRVSIDLRCIESISDSEIRVFWVERYESDMNALRYESSQGLVPNSHFTSTRKGSNDHETVLRALNNPQRFKILYDAYQTGPGDYLFRELNPRSYRDYCNDTSLLNSPRITLNHFKKYRRFIAKIYALTYCSEANPSYCNYGDGSSEGGDCANFVSQTIYEGGDFQMCDQWYCYPVIPPIYCYKSKSWSVARDLGEFALSQLGYDVQNEADLEIGDIIIYEPIEQGGYWHSAVVIDQDLQGIPSVAYHTPNTCNANWNLDRPDDYFFHKIHLVYFDDPEPTPFPTSIPPSPTPTPTPTMAFTPIPFCPCS